MTQFMQDRDIINQGLSGSLADSFENLMSTFNLKPLIFLVRKQYDKYARKHTYRKSMKN
jgi:hypothetical protein